jgi:putative N6-adenine-specific DNA methylase
MKQLLFKTGLKEKNLFYATTFHGLEGILKSEIAEMGGEPLYSEKGIVSFAASLENVMALNYFSRVANKFVWVLARRDRCMSFDELYRAAVDIPWPLLFEQHRTFAVESSLTVSLLDHSVFCSQKTKDAVVDRFLRDTGKRPDVDRKNPEVYVDVRIVRNELTIGINLSGARLFKRGYRDQTNEAPLKETLAAGIAKLALAGGLGERKKVIDPMCGSGTLLIEAAFQVLGRPSGLLRDRYGFMNLKFYSSEASQAFKKIRARFDGDIRKEEGPDFLGCDVDASVLSKAKGNARHAGLERKVRFVKQDFFHPIEDMTGSLILFNPPYGERLKKEDINGFYASIGDSLKHHCKGSKAFIFAEFGEAIKHIGLRPNRRLPIFNGTIECRLLEFDLF